LVAHERFAEVAVKAAEGVDLAKTGVGDVEGFEPYDDFVAAAPDSVPEDRTAAPS
jgi:hypothetical protein